MSEYSDEYPGTCSRCNLETNVWLYQPEDEESECFLTCTDCFLIDEEKRTEERRAYLKANADHIHLCKLCGLEEPMYPHHWDSGDECGIYCADCFWEEDSKRKNERRAWLHSNPEALLAYQKHVCEVLNLPTVQISNETQ
jgi:hypothetical protein